MRIGLLVENAAPFVTEEARALRALGIAVDVASVFRPQPGWADAFGAPVDYPPAGRTGWGVALLRGGVSLSRESRVVLSRALQEGAPVRLLALADRLARRARASGWRHVHGSFATFPAWTAWAVGTLAHIPWSFTAHAYDVQEPRPWLGRLAREASFVRAISREGAQRVCAAAAEGIGTEGSLAADVRVGPLGVDLQRFRPRPVEPADPPEIVCVAALGPTKGLPVLLDAAARLRADGVRFRLRILGDGPLREALAEQATAAGLGAGVLEGAASRSAVCEALARATAFALPCVAQGDGRRHDGLPVALIEAMASGLPVISTRLGGIPETIENDRNGLLVAPGDGAALAGQLARVLGDASLRRRLGRAARDTAVRRHDGRDAALRLARWVAEAGPPRAARARVALGARG